MWMLFPRFASWASVPAQQNVSSSGCGVKSKMVLRSVFSSCIGCALSAAINESASGTAVANLSNSGLFMILLEVLCCDPVNHDPGHKRQQPEADELPTRCREHIRPSDERDHARQRIQPHPKRTLDLRPVPPQIIERKNLRD